MHNRAALSTLFALLVLLVAGCGGTWSDEETLPPLPEYPPVPAAASEALKAHLETLAASPEPLRRAHAAVLLGSEDAQAAEVVPYLLAALEDPDRTVRAGAAESLGRIGDPRAVEPLIAVIEDRDGDWSVRARAAWSLGKLKDRRATGPLVAALADMVSHVRLLAATALGEIGDPAAEEALRSTAQHDSDLGVRYAAKEALAQIVRSPQDAAEEADR